MYEYYVAIIHSRDGKTPYTGLCYKIDFKIDSAENMIKFQNIIRKYGYENPVIVYLKQLNE